MSTGPTAMVMAGLVSVAVLAAPPARPEARQTAPFSLGQILAAPFTSELVAAPAGQGVAWVFDDRGARNLWVAEGPAFARRRVTSYIGDDGQEITNVAFTHDGAHLVYVRGGGANRAGEIPNPTSAAAGAEQAVWVVPVAGGAPRKLAAGASPVPAPTGDLVAFVQRGQIWTASPARRQPCRRRGCAAAPVRSPGRPTAPSSPSRAAAAAMPSWAS
jgi:hypothetical protein